MPMTLELAKLHCRIDGNHEDELVQDYLDAAVAWVEKYTGHALTQKQVTTKFKCFSSELRLDVKPVRSVETVSYLDQDGAEQEFAEFRRYRDDRLVPQVGFSWPNALDKSDIEVDYTVGYDNAPKQLLQAVRLLLAHQYENREAVLVGTIASNMPSGVISFCHPFRGERV